MMEVKWRETVLKIINIHNVVTVPSDLILAIIQQESGGDPWACRFEPLFYDKYIKSNEHITTPPGVSMATEQICRATSWGLMQIMGQVARERGFTGKFLSELCQPEIGLLWAMLHLDRFYKKYTELDAIASYNAGSPRKKTGSLQYVNQDYVDGVLEWRRKVTGDIKDER